MEVSYFSDRVLVLNRGFVPVHVTSLRRAFCMLYMGVARALDEQYQSFDFESWSDLKVREGEYGIGVVGKMIRTPRVILLQVYDRLPKKQVRFSRNNIYARDKNRCQYCGKTFPKSDLNLDHVLPKSRGGGTNWGNIVCSCVNCNRKKGGRTPEEANMNLLSTPKRPSWKECLRLSAGTHVYQEWMPFLNITDFSYWNVELEES